MLVRLWLVSCLAAARENLPVGGGRTFTTRRYRWLVLCFAILTSFLSLHAQSAPSITSLSPNSGPSGTALTITGSGFGATPYWVSFPYGVGANVTSWSDTQIVVTVPLGATTGNVTVLFPTQSSNGMPFTVSTPSVLFAAPLSGSAGTPVTITGSGFGATPGTVTFNGTPATPSSWSDTQIATTVPDAATTGYVTVTAGGQSSPPYRSFTVPLTITSLSPNSGPLGTVFTITGNGFGATTESVTFTNNTSGVPGSGYSAVISSWSPTQIVATVPNGALTGDVFVGLPSGSSNGMLFTLTGPPTLSQIAVTPGSSTINVGAQQQFTAIGTYTDGSTQNLTNTVTWFSQSANATMSSTGLATGVQPGQAGIVAMQGGFAAGAILTVVAAPTLSSIGISPQNPSIFAGNQQQFTATGTYNDGSTQDITSTVRWASSSAIATISSTGMVSTTAPGASTITATSGSVTGSTTLTVLPPALVSVAVSPTNPSVPQGSTQQFTAIGTYIDSSTQDLTSTATWSSAFPSVATINSAGFATGVGVGTTTITATSGTVSGSSTLTVTQPPPNILGLSPQLGPVNTYVTITGSNLGASPGSVAFNGINATKIIGWSDSVITALVPQGASSGPVVVTARGVPSVPSNPQQFSVTLGIGKLVPPSGIAGTTNVTILGSGFGQDQGLSAVIFNGVTAPASHWSDSSIIVQVPLAATTGPVVVNVGGSNSNGVYFTVQPPPGALSSITMSPATATMIVGQTRNVALNDSNGTPITTAQWSVSDNTLLSLSSDNPPVLSALAPGTVTLTAAYSGFTASSTITIVTGPLATGTVLWSVPAVSAGQLVHVDNAADGRPTLYTLTPGGALSAFTDDGQQLWTVTDPSIGNVAALDNTDGILYFGSSLLTRRDSATGLVTWNYDNSPNSFGRFIDLSKTNGGASLAVHQDGTIYVPEIQPFVWDSGYPNYLGHQLWDIVALNPVIGLPKFTIPMPLSQLTKNYPGCPFVGVPPSSDNETSPGASGDMTIGGDGSIYVEIITRNWVVDYPGGPCSDGHQVLDDKLSLYTIQPDGSLSSQQLAAYHYDSATSSAGYGSTLPGYAIPDNNGGILAFWNYTPPSGPSEVHIWHQNGGSYTLPSLQSQNFWIAGERTTIYATGTTSSGNTTLPALTAFDADTGAVQWTNTLSSGGGFQLNMAATDGLFASSYDPASGTQFLKFDTSGNATPYNFGVVPTYAANGNWNLVDPNGSLVAQIGPASNPADALWLFQAGNQAQQHAPPRPHVNFLSDGSCSGFDNAVPNPNNAHETQKWLFLGLQGTPQAPAQGTNTVQVQSNQGFNGIDFISSDDTIATVARGNINHDKITLTVTGLQKDETTTIQAVSHQDHTVVYDTLHLAIRPRIEKNAYLFAVSQTIDALDHNPLTPTHLPNPTTLQNLLESIYGRQANVHFTVHADPQTAAPFAITVNYDSNHDGALQTDGENTPSSAEAIALYQGIANYYGCLPPANNCTQDQAGYFPAYIHALSQDIAIAERPGQNEIIQDAHQDTTELITAHEMGHSLSLHDICDPAVVGNVQQCIQNGLNHDTDRIMWHFDNSPGRCRLIKSEWDDIAKELGVLPSN